MFKFKGTMGCRIIRNGKVRFEGEGGNRILDNFFNTLSSAPDTGNLFKRPYFKFGSSTAEPENTQTGLIAPWDGSILAQWPKWTVAYMAPCVISANRQNATCSLTSKTVIQPGTIHNIAMLGEVGVHFDGTPDLANSNTHVRYRFVDHNSQPLNIEVTGEDEIHFWHVLECTAPSVRHSMLSIAGQNNRNFYHYFSSDNFNLAQMLSFLTGPGPGLIASNLNNTTNTPWAELSTTPTSGASETLSSAALVSTFVKDDATSSTFEFTIPPALGKWSSGIAGFKQRTGAASVHKYAIDPPLNKANQEVKLQVRRTFGRG